MNRSARVDENRVVEPERQPALWNSEAVAQTLLRRTVDKSGAGATKPETFVDIAMAIDENYARHAAASILSTISNAVWPESLRFHVLSDPSLSDRTRIVLKQHCARAGVSIQFYDVARDAYSMFHHNRKHISTVTYFRLSITEILPKTVERVVYLDADTIVVDDLRPVFDEDMQGFALAACPDEGGVIQSRRLGLPSGHCYFNAGVLLLDLRRLREMDLFSEAVKTFEQHASRITLQDQDILNLLFSERTWRLPLRYNAGASLYVFNRLTPSYSDAEARAAAADPAILHFTDAKKPWSRNCVHPLREVYWFYRNQTPWRENLVDGAARWIRYRLRDAFSPSQRRLNEYRAEQVLRSAESAGKVDC